MQKRERQLALTYYNVKGVGGFGGIRPLAKTSKVRKEQAKAWLMNVVKTFTPYTNLCVTSFPEERPS